MKFACTKEQDLKQKILKASQVSEAQGEISAPSAEKL